MSGSKVSQMSYKPDVKDLVYMKELIEAGKVVPVIARRFPLSEIGEAFRYFEEGHPSGKVVITVEHSTGA
jgi:NADPH:quinone reductase-like Zn-dependent oxidoreductase